MDKDKKIEIQKRIIRNLEDENLVLTQKNKEYIVGQACKSAN